MLIQMVRTAFSGAALALVLAQAAQAGPIADKARETEKLLAANKPAAALMEITKAMDAIWAAMPFTIGYAALVKKKPAGYGIYNPRKSNVYKIGQTMWVYVEPIGFGYRQGNGLYQSEINADIFIKDKSGVIVMGKEDYGKFKFTSRRKNREFMINLSLELTGAPEGEYVLTIPLKDQVKGQRAAFSLPFRIVK